MKQMQKRTCMGIVLLILTLTMTACSTETITETYEQYRPQMERTAMHFLKSHADVEDAVQNAFMQMIRHLQRCTKGT